MTDPEALIALLRSMIADQRVLDAIASVPRERFVPAKLRRRAYDNEALPIGCGQTISQPIVVARMLELLELDGSERVLDVGTGSGYHAALLARLAREVYSVERHAELSELAATHSRSWGSATWSCSSATAAPGCRSRRRSTRSTSPPRPAREVPAALMAQLAPGGRLVAPVGAVAISD